MWRLPITRARLNDIGICVIFAALGIGLHLAGMNSFSSPRYSHWAPIWFPMLMLGIMTGCQYFRRSHPTVALTGAATVIVIDIAAGGSVAV